MNEHIIHQDSRSYITEMQLENAVLYKQYKDGNVVAECKLDTMQNVLLSRVYEIKGGVYARNNEAA